MILSPRGHLAQIQKTASELGVALPRAFTDQLAAAAQLVSQTEHLESHTGELNAAVVDALLNNRDVAADKDVRRLVVLRTVATAGCRQAGAERANQMLTDAITEFADEITRSWAKALTPDCDTLRQAAEHLDLEDLRGPDAAAEVERTRHVAMWGGALASFSRIQTGVEGLAAVLAALSVTTHGREHRPLLLAECEAISSAAHPAIPNAWHAVRTGARLAPPTATEFRQRVSEFNDARDERQRLLEESRQPSGFDGQHRAVVPT